MEHLHNWGMIVAFGFTAFGFMELLDRRVLKLNLQNKPCTAVSLCGICTKNQESGCKARQLFLWILIAAAITAILPLPLKPNLSSNNSLIFGTYYYYSELVIFQLFESRYLPILALLFFVISLAWLYISKDEPLPIASRIFFAAGVGVLGFSVFRLLLVFFFPLLL